MTLLAVQQIVYAALNGNITGGLYDDTPDLPEGMPLDSFPYTVIGDDAAVAFDTDDWSGLESTVVLHIWSRYGGASECKTIMAEIYALLHKANLTSASYDVVDSLCTFQEVLRDPDGQTRHGVMRFRITISDILESGGSGEAILLEDGTELLLEDGTSLLLE